MRENKDVYNEREKEKLNYIFSHLKILNVTGLQLGDIPVPKVVNDLGEVDGFGQSPGNILTHACSRNKNHKLKQKCRIY